LPPVTLTVFTPLPKDREVGLRVSVWAPALVARRFTLMVALLPVRVSAPVLKVVAASARRDSPPLRLMVAPARPLAVRAWRVAPAPTFTVTPLRRLSWVTTRFSPEVRFTVVPRAPAVPRTTVPDVTLSAPVAGRAP